MLLCLFSAVLSINLPLFFVAFTPAPAHARTVHRWGSLGLDHSHVDAHLDVPTIHTNPETHEPDLNPDLPLAIPNTEPSQTPNPAGETEEDDWLKWHHERHEQQDLRRKLECRTVEFGRCDVHGRALKVRTVGVAEAEGREQIGHDKQEGEFVGKRLPRSLQEWLAREGGGR